MQVVESGSLSFMPHATTNAACDAIEFTWSFPFVSLHQEAVNDSAWNAVATSDHRHPLAGRNCPKLKTPMVSRAWDIAVAEKERKPVAIPNLCYVETSALKATSRPFAMLNPVLLHGMIFLPLAEEQTISLWVSLGPHKVRRFWVSGSRNSSQFTFPMQSGRRFNFL